MFDFSNIDAFVFCAGLGTRLRPITETIPKPLVKIHGKPLLEYQLDWLNDLGFRRVIINTHHLRELFHPYKKGYKNLEVVLSEEENALGHAGGLKHAEDLIKSHYFFAMNGDTILRLPPEDIADEIKSFEDSIESFLVYGFKSQSNTLAVNADGELIAIADKVFNQEDVVNSESTYDAIGAYIIRKDVLELVSAEEGFVGFYGNDDLIERLLRLNKQVKVKPLQKYKRYEVTNIADLERINAESLDLKL